MNTRTRRVLVIGGLLGFLTWVLVAPSNRAAAAIFEGDGHVINRRFDDAVKAYARAVESDPSMWRSHLRYGTALRLSGRLQQAESSYENALRLAPNEPEVLLRSASYYLNLRSYDRVRELLRRELSIEPGNFEAFFLLAEMEMEKQNPERATSWLKRITEHNPYHYRAHWKLAEAQRLYDRPAAIASCEKVLGFGAPPIVRGQTFLMLAALFQAEGQTKQARQALATLMATYPNTREAQRAREMIESL